MYLYSLSAFAFTDAIKTPKKTGKPSTSSLKKLEDS